MKTYPSIPHVADAPEVVEEGHLWLLEKLDGAQLRFQLRESGLIRFGTRERIYDDPGEVPAPYQHAVRHVRERLDRDALRRALDDVEGVVFFGEATHRHAIEYDWERTPSFLGFDVWADGRFLPPDATEEIFDRLGLHPVNAVDREVRARDFDPGSFEIPDSAWYDGPAAGVVIRNKRGGRAIFHHPDVAVDEATPIDASAEELAASCLRGRFETLASALEDRGEPVTVDALSERAFEALVREHHSGLSHGETGVELASLRSAVATLTQRFLDTSNG